MQIIYNILIFIAVVFLASCSSGSSGGSDSLVRMLNVGSGNREIILEWQPPSENFNGTPFNDLGGYNVYFANSPEDIFNSLGFNAGEINQVRITGVQECVLLYFSVTSFDLSGNESEKSEIIEYEFC